MVIFFIFIMLSNLVQAATPPKTFVDVMDELHRESLRGDAISAMAYEAFHDLALKNTPRWWNRKDVQKKLLSKGLCCRIDGVITPIPEALVNCFPVYVLDPKLKKD